MRDYGKRDPSSHRTPEQIKDMDHGYNRVHVKQREERNQARAIMRKKLGAKAIQGRDIDHIRPVRSGGGNSPGNLRAISPSRNRGWNDGKV